MAAVDAQNVQCDRDSIVLATRVLSCSWEWKRKTFIWSVSFISGTWDSTAMINSLFVQWLTPTRPCGEAVRVVAAGWTMSSSVGYTFRNRVSFSTKQTKLLSTGGERKMCLRRMADWKIETTKFIWQKVRYKKQHKRVLCLCTRDSERSLLKMKFVSPQYKAFFYLMKLP